MQSMLSLFPLISIIHELASIQAFFRFPFPTYFSKFNVQKEISHSLLYVWSTNFVQQTIDISFAVWQPASVFLGMQLVLMLFLCITLCCKSFWWMLLDRVIMCSLFLWKFMLQILQVSYIVQVMKYYGLIMHVIRHYGPMLCSFP